MSIEEYVKENFVKIKETDKEIPATKAFTEEASMEEIFEAVDKMFSEGRLSRDVKLYLCHRYTSVHLNKIGEQFKVSESAVSHAVSGVSKTIARDKKVRKKIDKLIKRLKHSRFKTCPLSLR
ncbi:Chromosomal replication initiator protein DnaA [subsurface metagenome]